MNDTCYLCGRGQGVRPVGRGNARRAFCRRCVPDRLPCAVCHTPGTGKARSSGRILCDGCFDARPKCRHCNRCIVTRPWGLCWVCYHTPGVRDAYRTPGPCRSSVRGASSGVTAGYGLPPEPTAARPGTEDKIAVLAERAEAGLTLFHPRDAGFAGDRPALALYQSEGA